MHESVLEFVREHQHRIEAPVLEVGSRNVNGSVRPLCPRPYTGIDLAEGPGVNRIYDPVYGLPFVEGEFKTVISTEMLEHADDPVWMMREMVRVLAPGRLLLVTARGNGFKFHNPPDRWRIMPGTLKFWAESLGVQCHEIEDPQTPGVFLIGNREQKNGGGLNGGDHID